MNRLIDIHLFGGWKKRERAEFWASLLLTVVFCAALYIGMIAFYCIRS